jgi:hypothetical protein
LTNHLNRAGAGLWLSDRVASKHGARGAFGIHGVAFSLLIPHLPIGPAGTVVLARWTPAPVIAAAAVDVLVGVTPMMTSMGTLLVTANISRPVART